MDSYQICVKDMVEGDMKREMMEIAWEKPSESKGSGKDFFFFNCFLFVPSHSFKKKKKKTEGEKKRGLLYFHVVFEGDQTLAQYLPLEQLLMRDKFLILDCLCNTVCYFCGIYIFGFGCDFFFFFFFLILFSIGDS